jgi:FkbM family methyltransferase
MTLCRASATLRTLMWRLGRKMYAYARGDGPNDPRTNGEYWLVQHLLNARPGPSVLFDVGANKGDWTAQVLELARAGRDICVFAFEPSRATRSILSARFVGNPAVNVQPYAVSDAVGKATFYSETDGGGTNSLSSTSGSKEERVDVITLDEFIRQTGLEAISMAKIDTEGFDLLVLRGTEKALTDGLIEVVQFEYNWRWLLNHASLRDVFNLASNKPYRLGKLVGESIEFYQEWHSELDRFFENNYVLIRRDSKLCGLGVEAHFDNSDAIALNRLRQSGV